MIMRQQSPTMFVIEKEEYKSCFWCLFLDRFIYTRSYYITIAHLWKSEIIFFKISNHDAWPLTRLPNLKM